MVLNINENYCEGGAGDLKETTTIHSHGFLMALLQWHNVYKLGEDELLDPHGGLKLAPVGK